MGCEACITANMATITPLAIGADEGKRRQSHRQTGTEAFASFMLPERCLGRPLVCHIVAERVLQAMK